MTDTEIIDAAILAHQSGYPITDGQARVIASAWHGGQWTALYSFASTGAIAAPEEDGDTPPLIRELEREASAYAGDEYGAELEALLAYVERHGERGPVAGWSNLWG